MRALHFCLTVREILWVALYCSQKIAEINFCLYNGQSLKIWGGHLQKMTLMKINNCKVSKTTLPENYFVCLDGILEMQVSVYFFKQKLISNFSKNVFLFKVIFCRYFDVWYFNLTPIFLKHHLTSSVKTLLIIYLV